MKGYQRLFWLKRDLQRLCMLCFAAVLCAGCEKDAPTPLPASERTVLVYMVADSRLKSFAENNIGSMIQGMKGVSGTLIVYYDSPSATPVLYQIDNDGSRTVIKNYEEQNSCSKEVLSAVIADTKQLYPANGYGLVLWSHGKGWVPAELSLEAQRSRPADTEGAEPGVSLEHSIWQIPAGAAVTKSFGSDGTNEMEISDMATALSSGGVKFEFVLFDACFMSDVSVAYDLRNVARYMIASPAEVMATGFPYAQIVPLFFTTTFNPLSICEEFISYYRSQSGINQSGTVAAVDLTKMEGLAQSVRAVFDAYPSVSVDPSQVQYLELISNHVFFDLADYLSQFAAGSAEYAAFQTQLAQTVLFKGHTDKVYSMYQNRMFACPSDRYCGLSCYIPQTVFPIYNVAYHQQPWTIATAQ